MKKANLCLWGMMMVTLLLGSCSKKKNSALEVVPEDYEVVINVQLTKLADAAGEALNGVLDSEKQEELQKLGEVLDLDNTLVAVKSLTDTKDGDKMFVAVPVKNEGRLKKALGDAKSKDGFDVYTLESGLAIVVKDKIAYPFDEGNKAKALKVIGDALEDCGEDGSFADMKAATEAVGDDKAAVTLLVNTEILGKKDKEHGGHPMFVARLVIKDKNTIDFNGYSVYPDGTKFKAEQSLEDVSADVLKYAGANPVMTVAAGIPGNLDWKKIFKQYNEVMEDVDKSNVLSDTQILELSQLLNNIDGTVMCSIGLNGTIENTVNNRPDFILAVECKAGTEPAMLNMLKFAVQQQLGIDLQLNPDLTPAPNRFGPMTLYVGAIDGMVVISTKMPEKADNDLAAGLKGKQAGFILNLPNLGQILPALDTKINMTVVSDGNEMTGSFTCVDKPIADVLKSIGGVR